MNRLRRVVNNTLISLLGQAITWSSTLLLTVAYGRFLGDVKFGELYFAITFVGLIGFPIEFGFNQQITRDVAQDTDKALHYLSSTLLLKALIWSTFYGCMLLLVWHLDYTPEVRILVAICGLTLLSGAVTNTFISLHYAFERVVYPVIGTILEKGLGAVVGFILLKAHVSVEVMALILFGASIINASWQACWFIKLVGIRFTIDWKLIRKLVYTSIPFLMYGVLGVIYYRLDTVLLSFMANDQVVGWYGAAYRLFDTLVFLPSLVISAIMYPVFSKLSISSKTELQVAIEKTLNFLLFCGLPITTLLIVAAPGIIGFLYHNPEFVHSVPALQALAPGLLILYINSVLTAVLISTNQEKKITLMAAAALVFNLGLNLILIPRLLQVGAALVTSLTELLLMSLAVYFMPRYLIPFKSLIVGGKVLLASLAMAAVIVLLNQLLILAILPIAAVVYIGTAVLLRTFPREDLRALVFAIRHKAHLNQVAEAPIDIITASDEQSIPNIYAEGIEDTEDTEDTFDEDVQLTEKRPVVKSGHLTQARKNGYDGYDEDSQVTEKRPIARKFILFQQMEDVPG